MRMVRMERMVRMVGTLARQRKMMTQARRRQRVRAQVGVPNSPGSMLTSWPS